MMGMTMKEGRPARASDEIVVNEAFAERMRWGDKALNHPLRAEGRNLKESVRFACKASAISVTRVGAQSSAPYRNEVDIFD